MIDFIEKDRSASNEKKTDERVANAYGEYSDEEEEENFKEDDFPIVTKPSRAHMSK